MEQQRDGGEPDERQRLGEQPKRQDEATTAHPPMGASAEVNLSAKPPPVFPEERILVRAWPDPMLDKLGHDPRSPYVERFWLSILGPSSVLLLRRLALGLEASPGGFEIDPVAWAFELGLGMRGGKNGPFWRAIDRTCRFNATHRQADQLMVRRKLAPLTMRQIEKLPTHLQAAHHAWSARELARHQSLTKKTMGGDAA